ncbi:lipoyl(octanoyl) transferase LipB [Ectothiorhodospiraceae bacterium 2226]|nr:lipoyl(octanoyl) transferase LipB [Ectothiorhodospiraceae bacterium 2226]
MRMTASAPRADAVQVRRLGRRDYRPVWQAMQTYTDSRGPDSPDELWVVEHPPVYTLGLNAKPEHVLDPGDIPLVPVDRGGQVTYHGPGQVVVYTLLDLRRRGLGVRELVDRLELAVIDLLAAEGVTGERRRSAPGVYVGGAKIAALGLRVRRGCAYHGLALNVAMDLAPFARINPCGYPGLPVTQLADLTALNDVEAAAERLLVHLQARLAEASRAA